jgi:hypothetical protein
LRERARVQLVAASKWIHDIVVIWRRPLPASLGSSQRNRCSQSLGGRSCRQVRWIDPAQESRELSEGERTADCTGPQFDHESTLRTGHRQNEVGLLDHLLGQPASLKGLGLNGSLPKK